METGEAQSIEEVDEVLAGRRLELADFGKNCHRFSLNFTKTLSTLYVHIVCGLTFQLKMMRFRKQYGFMDVHPSIRGQCSESTLALYDHRFLIPDFLLKSKLQVPSSQLQVMSREFQL